MTNSEESKLDDWRVIRALKWDHHDQYLVVRPYVDTLITEIKRLRACAEALAPKE